MTVTKQFFKKRGGATYSVVVGKAAVSLPHNKLVKRTVIRANLVTNGHSNFPKGICGEAILNPVDKDVFDCRLGMNIAIDRAEKQLRGYLLQKGIHRVRGEITRELSGDKFLDFLHRRR